MQCISDKKLKNQLYSFKDSRAVFVKCTCDTIANCDNTDSMWQATCADGHKFLKHVDRIAWTIFNMAAAKNYAAELNSRIHASRKRKVKEDKQSSAQRKISKLSSSKM